MINTFSLPRLKILLSALFVSIAFSIFSQTQKNEVQSQSPNNSYHISDKLWNTYIKKTNVLLEKVDVPSFFNYVVMISDGNMNDMGYFMNYVNAHLKKDFDELYYKVGKGEITDMVKVKLYLGSLQPAYLKYFAEFKKNRDAIVSDQNKNRRAPGPIIPNPQSCGSPCTNPGFEVGTTPGWSYWGGDPAAAADPANLVVGFAPTPVTSGSCVAIFGIGGTPNPNPFMQTTAGGFDPTVGGTTLPLVDPVGGGSYALRVGDLTAWSKCSFGAARASISFTVSASNANFTYKYAIVLEDPNDNSHDAINGFTQRPYFRAKLRDQNGNVLTCGDYEVVADASQPGFSTFFTETSSGSNTWYRPWTSVFVPLSSYINTCVTLEFTSSDCVPGGHMGYGYVDCSCEALAIIASSPSICGGTSVTLTAPAGGASYVWSDSTGGTAGIVGATNAQTCVVNLAGTYEVVITSVAGSSCQTTLYTTIGSLLSNPVAKFKADTVCAGTLTHFTDLSTPLNSSFTWKWDFNVDGITDTTLQNPNHIFTAAGTYRVALTITWGSCTATDTQTVVVNTGSPPILTAAGPFCADAPAVNLVASITGGTWSGPGITNASLGTFTPSISIIGFDTVTYNTGGACPTTASEPISVTPIPISDGGPDLTICTGGSGTIGTGSTVGYTYSWSPTTGITSSTTISNPTVSLLNPGPAIAITTTYTVTTNGLGCTSTATVNVITDAVATVNAGSSQRVCPGSSFTLAGSVGGSASSGTWSGGSGSYAPNNTTLTAVYTPSAAEYAADSVLLTLTTDDPTGPCTFSSSNVTFYFYSTPIVNFSVNNPAGCPPGHCVQFYDSSGVVGGSIVAWTWTFGDGSPTSSLQNPMHCYTQTGYYDVTLTVTTNQGCTTTLTKHRFIQVFANPIAAFDPSPNPASVLDASVTMYNQSSSDVNYWYWNFGDGTNLSPSTISPEHIFPHVIAGNYIVTLIVHNADGCYDTVAHEIVIQPEFAFFIPNAFTPNGDGINDYFYGSGVGIVTYDLWIFDRWGNMIFHGLNLSDKWNGKANNGSDMAQIDTYVWKVKLMDIFNKTHDYIGTVTLVK